MIILSLLKLNFTKVACGHFGDDCLQGATVGDLFVRPLVEEEGPRLVLQTAPVLRAGSFARLNVAQLRRL